MSFFGSHLFAKKEPNYLGLIAVAIALIFVWPYITVILVSLITAYLCNPIYQRLRRRFGLATSVTLTIIFLILAVAVPLFILLTLLLSQAYAVASDIAANGIVINGQSLEVYLQDVVVNFNDWFEQVTQTKSVINEEGIVEFVKQTLPDIIQTVADLIIDVFKGIPSFFTNLILFLFIFSGALVNQEKSLDIVRRLSPFDKKTSELYGLRVRRMTKAMIQGQLVIAFCQAIAGALSLLALGLNDFFWFFIVIFTFLNMIPLGSGIILIPLGIISMLFGDFWAGVLILAVHFLITTNIDNVLRPKLVPKDTRLPAALLMLSVFAGVYLMGILGIIVGPVLMVILTTTVQVSTGTLNAK